MNVRVLKHGIGYDLVTVADRGRVVLGIRCHKCDRISFNRNDIDNRYCGACHVFHSDRNPNEA